MARLTSFLGRLILFLAIFIAVGAVLFTVQTLWHPFDALIAFVNQDIDKVGSTLSREAIGGISFGALALFLVMLIVPIVIRGVNTRQFLVSFFRGLLASVVYMVTDLVYTRLEQFGRFYLVLAIVGSIILTFILVEVITKAGKQHDEVSIRTDLMASISSGIALGLIIKLSTYGLQYLKPLAGL